MLRIKINWALKRRIKFCDGSGALAAALHRQYNAGPGFMNKPQDDAKGMYDNDTSGNLHTIALLWYSTSLPYTDFSYLLYYKYGHEVIRIILWRRTTTTD